MTNLKTLMALILAMSLSGAAFAQSTTETSETTTTETEAEAESEGAQPGRNDETFPVAGEEENGEPKVGQQYVRETHGDWEVRCIKAAEEGADQCGLYQLIKDSEGTGVAEFNMVALEKGSKAAGGVTFVTPLGTLLTAQTTMQVDSGKARRYPFSWCEQAGCIARFGLTQADVDSLKRGAAAKLTIVSIAAPDKPIDLTLSLNGVTAAWDSVAPK